MTQIEELTDEQYNSADRIDKALEEAGREGLTPSRAAKRGRTTTPDAEHILQWMVSSRMAHTSGNGAWTRYHHGRDC